MADIMVRAATLDDRPALEALIEACYGTVYPGWYDPELLDAALPQMLRIDPRLLASGRYFAATVDAWLAGCGGWSLAAPGQAANAAGSGHIRHFATHPDLMRGGVGSAILRRCIDEAAAAGVGELMCFSSLPGEPFYARHGFVRRDEVTIMLGETIAFPAVLMRRPMA